MNWLENTFKLRENNTTVKREIYGGLISFLAVSYILAVNPAILKDAGMDQHGVFFVTAISAFIGTLLMALLANYPLMLAPGMGLNAFFAYTVVKTMGYSWQFALFAIVCEGIIFLLLSISSIRERIINSIPVQLKYAMGAGVGLFITLVAFKSANIVRSNPDTLIAIQRFSSENFHTAGVSAMLAFAGILITGFLFYRKVPGSILIGILATWGLGMICQASGIYHVVPEKGFFSLFPNFDKETFVSMINGVKNLFGAAFDVSKWSCSESGNTGWELMKTLDFAIICFAFLFSDFFDSVGTINGAMAKTPLMKEDGTIPRLRGALLTDSIATCFGGIFGTSTVTMFAESATGIAAGARTGLAAVTGAVLFLIAPIAAPIFIAIPGFATAPALIFVGFLMLRTLNAIDMDDVSSALPAFLTVCGMAFTYSISDGLGIGIISWTILNCRIKGRVNWLLWLVTLIFVTKYIFL